MSEDLLPPSATPQERATALATARVGSVPTPLRELWDADTCPEALLPWLAWAYSVDGWDVGWTADQQRQAIKRSIAVHRRKGTIGAVKQALAALGFQAQVQEWFNQSPEGDPYTFKLLINAQQVGFSQLQFLRLMDTVDASKNLRSWLDEVVPTVTSQAGPHVAAVACVGSEVTVTGYVLPPMAINELTLGG